MKESKNLDFLPWFMITVSIVGVFIVLSLSLMPVTTIENAEKYRPIIGTLFIALNLLGIVAVFFPQECSSLIQTKHLSRNWGKGEDETRRYSILLGFKITHGHHPFCEGFSTHEWSVGDKSFCVGCFGLLTGAIFAILGAVSYFYGDFRVNEASVLVGIGSVGILLTLLHYSMLNTSKRGLRFLLNAYFTSSFLLILMGIDTRLHSVTTDLLVVMLSVFWLLTRINLSKTTHEKICRSCKKPC